MPGAGKIAECGNFRVPSPESLRTDAPADRRQGCADTRFALPHSTQRIRAMRPCYRAIANVQRFNARLHGVHCVDGSRACVDA